MRLPVSDWRDIDDLIVLNPELSFAEDSEDGSELGDSCLSIEVAKERLFKLLSYLELVSLESIEDVLKRAYQKNNSFVIVPAHSGNFDLFFLKMSLEPVSMARLKLNRELFFSERLNEDHIKKLLSFRVPCCVKMDAGMSWVLYRGFESLKIVNDEFDGDELFLNLPKSFNSETLGDEYLVQIIASLRSLQDVSVSSLVLPSFAYMLRLEKIDYDAFLVRFQKIQKQLHYSNLISSKHWYRLYQLLAEKKELIESSQLVLSHGSFSEQGMIFGKESLYLFNWSNVRLCNASYDLANLWMSASGHIAWRRNLIRQFMKDVQNSETIMSLFQIDLLYLSLQMIQSKSKHGINQENDIGYLTFVEALEDIKNLLT